MKAAPRSLFAKATDAVAYLGELVELIGRSLRCIVRGRFEIRAVSDQVEAIGIRSLVIVVLTAVFSSMVMTVQFAGELARFGARGYVGNVVSLSLIRELGPVLTALMVGGRVGAGIAAELGSMNVSEQIDAMRSMGADPVEKLVVPRVLATTMLLPLLTTIANTLGILGAMVIARLDSGINMSFFYHSALDVMTLSDFMGGLAKTLFFGFALSLIACHQGLTTRGGTEGVGHSTTFTVVLTSVTTLISDFFLTKLLLDFGL
jgi:phospholipid/cholesterol/gamma-HCH transport system permease protein